MENLILEDKQLQFLKKQFEQQFEQLMRTPPLPSTTDREYSKALSCMLDVLFETFLDTDSDEQEQITIDVAEYAMAYVAQRFGLPIASVVRDTMNMTNTSQQDDMLLAKMHKHHNRLQ